MKLWKKIMVLGLIGVPYLFVLTQFERAANELGWTADVGGYAFVIGLTVAGLMWFFLPDD